METRTVRAHLKARGWSRSELARRVEVSRQAVSLWLRQNGRACVRSEHLLRVSEVLDVPVQELLEPLPCLGEHHDRIQATLLWDQLYGSLVDFALAAARWEPRAVGRLVEVCGIYAAAKILGQSVWRKFPAYARYIHPTRRHQLETLVKWHRHRTTN